ncbi:hypothetical protein COCC4DRAFT_166744 [Bipolaris maydis ATCC 48331]|uniref:Beta-lactamase-related domain-containing protein n=2 Tax=Cochliobolus heterostrophus TaxID=5016 RepID=M2UEW8_COCH5|nr:uncharacterized protein COCC4DRAFT_166744 [Bipolaris maydis ATCC 48331]EMD86412.1 hypothetical protein COCHEDRAFT_1198332 [Bipolaris maydis C5]KAJ5029929.1 beta-lactamase/transpeptidase-like protein [Bipolaris maydis]ENI06362.1 hypothetical protein COCC4DRAFT_166744 [Bipolaris maydis ATCC 48331]KAJ6214030.1 beta-lactamase/transpeptidase-like protein [Bipolaris maydis]KAJ6275230.1 beta-lactamase/transpeptidase-like protein [Bipolaris maydis]
MVKIGYSANTNVFFDINGKEVETRIAKLKAEGYRPTSLSIHGTPADAKYAGIWTKQGGSPYETIVGANKTTYDAWLEQWRASGYVSTQVSATGPASNAVFAGVMEQIPSVGNWTQLCGLGSPYAYLNATQDVEMVIKGVSLYGTSTERQYCILGHENKDNHQQTVWYPTSPSQDYKSVVADETTKRFWRPVFIDSSEDKLLSSIFDDTSVGKWTVRTDLTASQLQSEIIVQRANGMYPIHISGAGSVGIQYVVIFAERITPLERNWHAVGDITGFPDNAGVERDLDGIMQKFMKRSSVRQAQVSASINGTVVASRAYTWAESDRAIVEPSDKFLLGSVSKAFTYAAVDHLVSTGIVNLTDKIYPLLGYTKPADPRSLNITIQQLLDHTGGFDRGVSPDIGFIFTTVAQSLNQSTPATLRQLIEYVAARPLDFEPGTKSVYSNYGTLILGYLIANKTGETYMSYLEKNVLKGLDVEMYTTAAEDHVNDRIVQETKTTSISALTPLSNKRAPGVHGGDGAVKEAAVSSFALKASASTVSQFIGNHAAYGLGPRQIFEYRDGTVAGARALGYSMAKLDWAITLNTREYLDEQAWNTLVFDDLYSLWGSLDSALPS